MRTPPPSLETKFLRLVASHPIGAVIDGWTVTWCYPDRRGIVWHAMLVRPAVEFRGCDAELELYEALSARKTERKFLSPPFTQDCKNFFVASEGE